MMVYLKKLLTIFIDRYVQVQLQLYRKKLYTIFIDHYVYINLSKNIQVQLQINISEKLYTTFIGHDNDTHHKY